MKPITLIFKNQSDFFSLLIFKNLTQPNILSLLKKTYWYQTIMKTLHLKFPHTFLFFDFGLLSKIIYILRKISSKIRKVGYSISSGKKISY